MQALQQNKNINYFYFLQRLYTFLEITWYIHIYICLITKNIFEQFLEKKIHIRYIKYLKINAK